MTLPQTYLVLFVCVLLHACQSTPEQLHDLGHTDWYDANGSDLNDTQSWPEDLVFDTAQADAVEAVGDVKDTQDDVSPQDTTPAPAPLSPALYPSEQIHSPLSPFVRQRLQEVATYNPDLSDAVFMKVGASTTVSSRNLKCLADPDVDLKTFDALQGSLDFFLSGDAAGTDPFTRTTKAAKSGYSAGWAISGDPSPLLTEYDEISPRFALIHYGTNDMGLGSTYQSAMYGFYDNMMDMADQLVERGVIPMFFGIVKRGDSQNADRWVGTYNAIIRAIAQAHQVPFVDVHFATRDLPGAGLASDGLHLNTFKEGGSYDACEFSEDGLEFGFSVAGGD